MKTAIATALIFGSIFSPIIPTDDEKAVKWAEHHRDYLTQREAYMQANQIGLNIPPYAIEKAVNAKNKFEDTLLEKGYTKDRSGVIESPNTSVIDIVSELDFVEEVVAFSYPFGKETLEDCSSLPCTFTGDYSYGGGAMNLDNTSKVNGTDSLRCDITDAETGCVLGKTLTSDDTYYVQYYLFLPTDFDFGGNSFFGIYSVDNGLATPVSCNLEDYGTVRIACFGELGIAYTDTGINVATGTPTKLEFKVRVGTTTGDLDIWKNNDSELLPDFNGTGNYSLGTSSIVYFDIGGHHQDIDTDAFFDDIIADVGFIGDGTRFQTEIKGGSVIKGGTTINKN